jgi:hypothetical protein
MRTSPNSTLAVALVVALSLAPRGASAAEVHADPSDLQAKLDTLSPGDTLHLAPGVYSPFVIQGRNGSASAWITITADGGGATARAQAGSNTIEIRDSSFVAIVGLTIDGQNIDGAFGVSANGGASNTVHDVRLEGNTFVNHRGSQQHDAISTKTPTWGWIIRRNHIDGAGTGIYLGNSDGSDPFVAGLIEDNLIEHPIGYCMEIKHQPTRPPGMPSGSTIIRNNVFIKDDSPSPDGDRPNLFVGALPTSGDGATDRYEIDGNVFDHNPRESLFQGTGRVSLHDNVFVDAPGQRAIYLSDHDGLPLVHADVYDNTAYAVGTGVSFGNAAANGDAVVGNLIFADTPTSGPIANAHDNLTDAVARAGDYVKAPSTTLGAMDFYPLPGRCRGPALDVSAFAADVDGAIDFNGTPRAPYVIRGAYEGEGANPGWAIADAIKPVGGAAAGQDAGVEDTDGGGAGGGDDSGGGASEGAGPPDGGVAAGDATAVSGAAAGPPGAGGACGVAAGAPGTPALVAWSLAWSLLLLLARGRRAAARR